MNNKYDLTLGEEQALIIHFGALALLYKEIGERYLQMSAQYQAVAHIYEKVGRRHTIEKAASALKEN